MKEKEKPGFMMYHRQLAAMLRLDGETFKALMAAIGEYSRTGKAPVGLDAGSMALFDMYQERVDTDAGRYEARVQSGRKGGIASGKSRRLKAGLKAEGEANQSEPKQTQANEPPTSTTTPTSTPTTTATPTPSSSSGPLFSGKEPESFIEVSEEEEFPPTKGMILSYAREKGIVVDADDFLERCRATGWKDGEGRPVRNWRLWLKGYLVRQAASSGGQRTSPDPRILALERLKQRYIAEEAAGDE